MWVDGFDYRYYAGRKIENGRETYVSVLVSKNNDDIFAQLTVAERDAMQNKMVDAAAMAKGLGESGHIALYGIYFDTDKAVLKSESEGTLQQVLSLLKDAPGLRIAIAGHTDSQSSDSYNLDLSKRRALAVVKWLTDKGIAASRLEAQGFGESQPVADNDSAAGRALNRRVEIRDLTR